jgi:hypothetical protein
MARPSGHDPDRRPRTGRPHARPTRPRDRLTVRSRRRADRYRLGSRQRIEGNVRRVPVRARGLHGRDIHAVRPRPRLRAVRRGPAARRRRPHVLEESQHRAAGRQTGRRPRCRAIYGLGNRKNEVLLRAIERDGVTAYEGSRRYLQAVSDAACGASWCRRVLTLHRYLRRPDSSTSVEGCIDGVAVETEHLKGEPAPGTFLAGARCTETDPRHAAGRRWRLAVRVCSGRSVPGRSPYESTGLFRDNLFVDSGDSDDVRSGAPDTTSGWLCRALCLT